MSVIEQKLVVPVSFSVLRRKSLRWYLLLLLSLTLLVTLAVIGAGVYGFISKTERESWHERQNEAASYASTSIASFLRENEEPLTMVSVLAPTYVEQSGVLRDILQRHASLLEIIRVDKQGNIFAQAAQGEPVLARQFTIKQSNWFLKATQGQRYLGDVQIASQDRPYLIIAVPALDGGVVAARLDMQVLWDEVASLHFGKTGTVYIVNRNDQIIAHPDSQVVLSSTGVESSGVSSLLADQVNYGQHWTYTNFQGDQVVGVLGVLGGTEWRVITELAEAEASSTSNTALGLLIGGMVGFGILMLLLTTWLLSQRVLLPMEKLRAGAERIGQGDANWRLEVIRQDEIGQLAQAFNTMASAVEQREMALQQLAASLEQQVEERTAELRAQSEERVRLQDQVISMQATALAELSTPLIPISDQIVVMPLIGAMDSQRAQQVLSTLLSGVQSSRARIAILDITGVPVIDTYVANTLLQVAQMVRLLGARVVITGIRPEVAQTLVGLGVNLEGIVTHSILQQGIAYALRQLNEKALA